MKIHSGAVVAVAALLSLSGPFAMHAQMASSEVADFAFVVRTKDNSIELACVKGCAWKTLSFSARSMALRKIEELVEPRTRIRPRMLTRAVHGR